MGGGGEAGRFTVLESFSLNRTARYRIQMSGHHVHTRSTLARGPRSELF